MGKVRPQLRTPRHHDEQTHGERYARTRQDAPDKAPGAVWFGESVAVQRGRRGRRRRIRRRVRRVDRIVLQRCRGRHRSALRNRSPVGCRQEAAQDTHPSTRASHPARAQELALTAQRAFRRGPLRWRQPTTCRGYPRLAPAGDRGRRLPCPTASRGALGIHHACSGWCEEGRAGWTLWKPWYGKPWKQTRASHFGCRPYPWPPSGDARPVPSTFIAVNGSERTHASGRRSQASSPRCRAICSLSASATLGLRPGSSNSWHGSTQVARR